MLIQLITASMLILFVINFYVAFQMDNNEKFWEITFEKNIRAKRSLPYYKLNPSMERSCYCMTEVSCSCCESVMMLYTQITKQLCVNFMYQSGLNVNISLDAVTLRSTNVTTYRPFTTCATIPASLYSVACVNVLGLNKVSQSLTICVQLDIKTKGQNWKLVYRCISISTISRNNEKISSKRPMMYSNPSNMKRYAEKIFVTSTILRRNQTNPQATPLITEIYNQDIQLNSSQMPISMIFNNKSHLNITNPL